MSKLTKQIYYCDKYKLLDDIMYVESNSTTEILSDYDEDYLRELSEDKDILKMFYNNHCKSCLFRFNCALHESVHCDANSSSFDDQVEIYHNHAKELFEDAWSAYVNYED